MAPVLGGCSLSSAYDDATRKLAARRFNVVGQRNAFDVLREQYVTVAP
jgi:hypothetical protein